MSNHLAYHIWQNMKDRCRRPTHAQWKDYGAIGITVCERWERSFSDFWEDMGAAYQPGARLDRVDKALGFSPSNCVWVPKRPPGRQHPSTRNVDLTVLADQTGIKRSTLYARLKRGWPLDMLTLPTA